MKRILLVMALAFILPNPSPAMADGHGRDARDHYQERDWDRKFYEEQEREEREFSQEQEREARRFGEEQEREAREFYEKQERQERKYRKKMAKKSDKEGRKHGKKGKLPPGWRGRVEKGRHLDDDIYVELQPAPRDVVVALPPLSPGVSYKQVEDEIIKIDDVNRKILDVIKKTGLPLPPLPRLK